MTNKKLDEKTQNDTQVFNVLLAFVCFGLILLGFFQTFTNRLEDGLINMVIGIGLLSVAFSGTNFTYKTAPLWQKILIAAGSAFVVISSFYIVYLGVINR